ncbi:MAG: beta-ketoacyl-ACP synthase II [Chloroflexi bacterium]|nr:beta-ketoacyl-ACP synthase II [Chloroflexota bacterium]
MGALTPLGLDMKSTWEGALAGKSGIGPITLIDSSLLETKIAGEVKNFDAAACLGRKDARHMDRFTQLAVVAGMQAVEQAGLKISPENWDSIGIMIGSGIGGLTVLFEQIKVLLEKGPDKVSPFLGPMMIADMASARLSIALCAKGPNFCTTSACSSGADAIGTACEIIKRGDAKVMVAGGADSLINPIGVAAFNACKAISTHNSEPQKASRPFDALRDGFVIGEGAGVIVLESLSYARERGANILAEIVGYGASGDAYHITQPVEDGEGAARAMKMSLSKAGLTIDQVDYINAHGTSTPLNDKMETLAIKSVFGDRAYKVPISSTKSTMGHLIGAAGAVEAAICVLTIRNGIIPPTINLEHPDPDCDLDYVPHVARKARVKTALSNSFGFGGHNSALVFKEFTED